MSELNGMLRQMVDRMEHQAGHVLNVRVNLDNREGIVLWERALPFDDDGVEFIVHRFELNAHMHSGFYTRDLADAMAEFDRRN